MSSEGTRCNDQTVLEIWQQQVYTFLFPCGVSEVWQPGILHCKVSARVLIYLWRIVVICEGHMTILVSILDIMIQLMWKSVVATFKKNISFTFNERLKNQVRMTIMGWGSRVSFTRPIFSPSGFCSHSSISFCTCMTIINLAHYGAELWEIPQKNIWI